MKEVILEKINDNLIQGITTEPQVVYIFSQCRKYLESISNAQNKEVEKYPTLGLFSDWVLHSKLSRKRAIAKLDEFSAFFMKHQKDEAFEFMSKGFTLFLDLKNDLLKFFKKYGIDTDLIENKEVWHNFIKILFEVLKDIPLQSEGEIARFIFTDGIVLDQDGTFLISFTISLKNGGNKHFSMDLDLVIGIRDNLNK